MTKVCPKCHRTLVWGYPMPETIKAGEEGKIVLCGCCIEEKNYCPICGALVWEDNPEA